MSKQVIDTGLKRLWSAKSTTTAVFIPLTQPLNSTEVEEVRISRYLESDSGNLTVRPAYNMSDDGITWSSTVTGIGSFATTAGWVYNTSTETTVSVDPKLLVRFGLEVKNDSGVGVERAMGRLSVELTPTGGRTLAAPPTQVWSDGTSVSTLFHALTQQIPIQSVEKIRSTVTCEGDSGDAIIQAAYQVSDDGQTWASGASAGATDSSAVFGTAQDGNGKTYGATFAELTPDLEKQWVRFGIVCKNGTDGKAETCLATLRVDTRLST